MTPATMSADVREYLEAVRARLADLPTEEREHLLSDTETSLLAAAEEADGGSLAARLGPPERFADELRAAAGLLAPAREPDSGLRALLERPRVRAALGVARELAPAWWLARAYVAVGALVLAGVGVWSSIQPTVPLLIPGMLGFVVLAAAVVVSVRLGRRERGRRALALNLLLLVAAVPVAERVIEPRYAAGTEYATPVIPGGLAYDGQQLRNVYPYSRDGRLLHDVLLYDEAGRPLEVHGGHDPLRRTLRDRHGGELLNAFPIRYFERGTKRVARPDAGPDVTVPRIATPPLRR